jgi:hypothetical protein
MSPILATAHFTGMGFASTNKSRCKACKDASIARAAAMAPDSANVHASCMRRGATFADTEMTPFAPNSIISRKFASSPESNVKPAGQTAKTSRARCSDPVASLTATICGCRARRAIVAGNKSTEVRPGTLYRITGTAEASAAAMKCRYRPSCGGLL